MSLDAGDRQKRFESYEDYWQIPASEADRFAQALTGMLANQITLEQTTIPQAKGIAISDLSNFTIGYRHGLVQYMPREIHISGEEGYSVEQFISNIQNMEFVKPTSFIGESEYRFAFDIHDRKNIYQPSTDHILINTNPISSLLFK
ncbi:hypothetical protein D9M71_548180 [compost metagenome]